MHDPYDPRVVFDDIYGEDSSSPGEDLERWKDALRRRGRIRDVVGESISHASVDDAPSFNYRIDDGMIPVAEHLQDTVACWRDGLELFCTLASVDVDGRVQYTTLAAPLQPIIDEVVGSGVEAGVDVEDILNFTPELAQVIGGTALYATVCGLEASNRVQDNTLAGAYLRGTDVLIACGSL